MECWYIERNSGMPGRFYHYESVGRIKPSLTISNAIPGRLLSNIENQSQQCSRPEETERTGDPSMASTSCLTIHNSKDSYTTTESTCLSSQVTHTSSLAISFRLKSLNVCNLNIRHILSKMDEIRIIMTNQTCPDILGICETLEPHILDNQVAIDGFELLRKDRANTKNKTGGGLVLFFRNTIRCKRRSEFEISS